MTATYQLNQAFWLVFDNDFVVKWRVLALRYTFSVYIPRGRYPSFYYCFPVSSVLVLSVD